MTREQPGNLLGIEILQQLAAFEGAPDDPGICPVRDVLDRVGQKWTLLLLIALTYPGAQQGRDRFSAALPELIQFYRKNTRLKMKMSYAEFGPGDRRLDQALFLYLTGYDAVLEFSDQEKRHLGAYLRTGGLLFADDVRPDRPGVRSRDVGTRDTPFDRQLKARYGLNSLLWAPT